MYSSYCHPTNQHVHPNPSHIPTLPMKKLCVVYLTTTSDAVNPQSRLQQSSLAVQACIYNGSRLYASCLGHSELLRLRCMFPKLTGDDLICLGVLPTPWFRCMRPC